MGVGGVVGVVVVVFGEKARDGMALVRWTKAR